MRVLSLFDGISCGMVALERAGIPVEKYVAYEIDENAIKVSKNNYPQIEHKGDVFSADYSEDMFDLLIGGSPCTYWSIAKSGQGTRETTASGLGWELFLQYVRALREAKPKYFLYENNFSISKDIKAEITKNLGVEPVCIDSANFSAQNRKRVYWTNIPINEYSAVKLTLGDILQSNVEDKYWYNIPIRELDLTKQVCYKVGNWKYDMSSRVYNPKFKSPTLTCVSGGHQEKKVYTENGVRKLTPIEYERLQTLPDNYTNCLCDGKRYKALGNGWTVDVIAHILKGLPH